jgi:hypothetical protein
VTIALELSFYIPMSVILVFFESRNMSEEMAIITYVKMAQSGILSTVQVMISPELRNEFMSWFK